MQRCEHLDSGNCNAFKAAAHEMIIAHKPSLTATEESWGGSEHSPHRNVWGRCVAAKDFPAQKECTDFVADKTELAIKKTLKESINSIINNPKGITDDALNNANHFLKDHSDSPDIREAVALLNFRS